MTLEARVLAVSEIDIRSRIRSLLLSRNQRRPPQTPYSSEEQHRGIFTDLDCRATIDSSTDHCNSKLHLPEKKRTFSKSADMANDRELSNSESTVVRISPLLRTSSSVNNLHTSTAHAHYSEQELSSSRSRALRQTDEKSWLPRLEMRNLKTKSTNPKSCLEINTQIPPNDAELHADELNCCPPCEPEGINASRYIVNRTTLPGKQLRAEPTDLACFLAGCPPGQINCQKHQRISKNTKTPSGQNHQHGHVFKDLAKDVSRLGNSIAQTVAAKSPLTLTDIDHGDPQRPYSPLRILRGSQSVERIRGSSRKTIPEENGKDKGISSHQNGSSNTEITPSSSTNLSDKFPHAVQSLAATATETRSYSTTINTNFSLSGTKMQSTPRNDQKAIISRGHSTGVPDSAAHHLCSSSVSGTEKQNPVKSNNSPLNEELGSKEAPISVKFSNSSLKPKRPQSASLNSGASKRSAFQHSLLKTSVSESQPIDVGLPLPPQLTEVMTTSIAPPPEDTSKAFDKLQIRPSYGERDETQGVRTVIESKEAFSKLKPDVPAIFSLIEPLHVDHHIGFGPEIKNSLRCAVQVTVRKAIEDISVPSNTSPIIVANAYRRLVAQSFAEAAEDADKCLRRTSFWEKLDQPKEATNVTKPSECEEGKTGPQRNPDQVAQPHGNSAKPIEAEPATNSHDPAIKIICPEPPRDSSRLIQRLETSEKSACSGGKVESTENGLTSRNSTLPIEIEVEPLGRDGSLRENHKKLLKKSDVFKRRLHAVVPNRHSSKLRALSPKYCDGNTLNQTSSNRRDIIPQMEAVDYGLPKTNRASQSESSAESRDGPCSDNDHQTEQLLVLKQQHDHPSESDLVCKTSPNRRLGHKHTVHWLQDLLSRGGQYQSQLTNLPQRKRNHEGSSCARPRSQTLPVKSATHLLLGKSSDVSNTHVDAQQLLASVNSDGKAWAPVTFTKTINDLENLLNEALVIARLAADKKISDPTRKERIKQRHMSSSCSSTSEITSVGSIHESMRSCSDRSNSTEDETDHLSKINLHRQPGDTAITIHKLSEPNRCPSGWPPSGRGPTPYPPNSMPPSKESIFVDVPLLECIESEAKETQLIKCADPRSSRPETDLPFNEMRRISVPQVEFNTTEPFKPLNESSNKVINVKTSPSHTSPEEKAHRLWRGIKIDKVGLGVEIMAEKAQNISNTREISGAAALVKDQTCMPQGMSKINVSAMELRQEDLRYSCSLDGSQFTRSEEVDFKHGYGHRQHGNEHTTKTATVQGSQTVELRDVANPNLPVTNVSNRKRRHHLFNLKNTRHVSLRDHIGFSLTRSHKRQAIARDWSPGRKRFCAAVACISTALVGILVGVYAGETPAIQYWIVDFHHYTVLGNVFFFIGLSIPTFFFWPLPLLHGRKPYILGAMSLAMPLLFPQAVAVGQFRSPYVSVWRVALLLPRALMGFCLGFANMNFKSILTDLFGASLQSNTPHQEHVDEFDVRRHGGGMGVWLGLWTWSAMGSIGLGFLIGAVIINDLPPVWGFYISITIIAFVLFLNILTPEVRRSAYRRSVAEVKNGEQISRRLARGEVKMHLVQTGPKWWGEEFLYGLKLSTKMIKQPGFTVMALYVAWMYGQIVLIVLLLGSLCSNSYRFKSHQVGAAVAIVPAGALLAIPFQKASLFSRDRHHDPNSDEETYKKKIKWSSHLVRRAIFVLTLPFAGLAYTLSARGPPVSFILPILFAGLIAFLSNLAMAECHGIMMETYDTSDLQPGMTGRSRGSAGEKYASKRTNYSSFPRVASAFAITQGLGYLIAAVASGTGGSLTRNFGQQAASGIMAFILLILSLMLLGVLVRFKEVQIIPNTKKEEMEQYHSARRASATRQLHGTHEEEPLRPIIIGNPHHSTRRMSILELGSMSRFSEIRLKNRLVDEQSLEARHPNQQMMMDVKHKIREKELQVVQHVRRSLSRGSSRTSQRSKLSEDVGRHILEQGDLGGHREMGRMHSGNGSGRRRATDIRE